ncbi:MAG: tetratricopeptide repeat protein [Thermomicrobiales bacterium]
MPRDPPRRRRRPVKRPRSLRAEPRTRPGRRGPQERRGGLNNLGLLAREEGGHARARELQEESRAIREELGDVQRRSLSHANLGDIAVDLGEFAEAAASFARALAAAGTAADEGTAAWAHLGLGESLLLGGDADAAAVHIASAHRAFRDQRDELALPHALHLRGVAHLLAGDIDRAGEDLRTALRLRMTLGYRSFALVTIDELAILHALSGRRASAARLLSETAR